MHDQYGVVEVESIVALYDTRQKKTQTRHKRAVTLPEKRLNILVGVRTNAQTCDYAKEPANLRSGYH